MLPGDAGDARGDPCRMSHAELSRLAARRLGVITVSEALAAGVTRAQLRSVQRRGEWTSPARGVLVAAAAPTSWSQECAIAVTAARGVVSHRAAARLHRLDGFDEGPVELTVPRGRATTRLDVIEHRTTTLGAMDITEVLGMPVTSIARTLVDLGAVVEDDLVEQALDDALRQGFSARWISQTLERVDRPGPTGAMALRRVLARPDRRGPLPDSVFERVVERACRAVGMPPSVRQHEVRDRQGRLVARIDVAWPDLGIGVEAHSRRWHFGDANARADQHRANRLAALGWLVLFVGWADVDDPERFVALLRDASLTRTTGRPA